ncbi:UPF0047 domain protein [Xylariomycetidae sp. FL0641]|nr:UPF0047 domain protein [Xylariomycetidae sp. FL0641]
MPSSTTFAHNFYTLLILCILLLAFFPGAFHYLWTLPFACLTGRLSPSPVESDPAPPQTPVMASPWAQREFTLPPRSKGSYLITDHVLQSVPEIRNYEKGLLNLFVQHTSCALSLNENWDEDVRSDMTRALDRVAPEDHKGDLYEHSAEGPDDMPAHIKSALVGASVTVPIKNGKLATGTWQGIWYLEFRQMKHTRRVVATIQGEPKKT